MRKIRTEQSIRYGKARVIARYDKDSDEFIDYKVYDARNHVVLTTMDYDEANTATNGDIIKG